MKYIKLFENRYPLPTSEILDNRDACVEIIDEEFKKLQTNIVKMDSLVLKYLNSFNRRNNFKCNIHESGNLVYADYSESEQIMYKIENPTKEIKISFWINKLSKDRYLVEYFRLAETNEERREQDFTHRWNNKYICNEIESIIILIKKMLDNYKTKNDVSAFIFSPRIIN